MADETTPKDTPNSPTIDPPAVPPVDTPPADTPPADAPPADEPPADPDSSVLGGKVEDDKPAEDEAPAGPPEKYELALEGVTLDPEAVEAAEPVFRELNLTNDQANKLMPVAKDFAERTAQSTLKQIMDAGAQQKKDWLDAFAADPEIGGAKREETEHLAAKALDAMGYVADHPFRKALTETGFGNHPDMIRMARRMGELVGEDGFVTPNGAPQVDVPTEQRWYGKKGE